MARSHLTHQRGFTLIEMSIVLVIIGLIIGGILKGQELIESSRQKNLVSQIDRIRSGTTAFVDRFRSLPGDLGRLSILPGATSLLGSTGGDDNGIVGSTNGDVTTANLQVTTTTENVQFFNHLIVANLISGATAPSSVTLACFAGLCSTPSPLPSAAFPQSGLTIIYGSHPGSTNGQTGQQASPLETHWLVVSRFISGAGLKGGATDGVLPASRAFQVDSKYDDGSAGSGNIRTALTGTSCGTGTTDYGASDNSNLCDLMFTLQ